MTDIKALAKKFNEEHGRAMTFKEVYKACRDMDSHQEWIEAMANLLAESVRLETESKYKLVHDLLAVLHGDGGHYEQKVGTEQAIKDAQELLFTKWKSRSQCEDIRTIVVNELLLKLSSLVDIAGWLEVEWKQVKEVLEEIKEKNKIKEDETEN